MLDPWVTVLNLETGHLNSHFSGPLPPGPSLAWEAIVIFSLTVSEEPWLVRHCAFWNHEQELRRLLF